MPDTSWFPSVLILEGTCGAGKTSLGHALVSAAQPNRPVFLLSQDLTYGPIVAGEDLGYLDDSLNYLILSRTLDVVEERLRQAPRTLVVMDTFHWTQRIRPGHLSLSSTLELDRRIAVLGGLLVFVEVEPEVLERRLLKDEQRAEFLEYASKYGSTQKEVLRHFQAEAIKIRQSALRWSALHHRTLAGDAPLPETANSLLKFLRIGCP